ncbi:Aste57867_7072 [Aphanomyces stellatus]|uniref:Aste57867_7072 protein n=1 Tax=Aphanomyces stellatus TaxID=120398 RepID=A0A485KHU6_9STRA|nr:hypothetical protein As57867_007049 [Aphanomyces stellatus]VFT84013.1 Aste57867_7072 [Aphanomyces stellatus]
MKKHKADVDEQVKVTTDMDKATKHELKDALRTLDDANKCVANLDRRYIMEIKTFVNPPVLVHVVLNAMCVLFSVDPSWDNSKRLLGDVNFISSMLNYDKDNIPDAILSKLDPYLSNEMFNKAEVEKQSIAASTMVVWIIAINSYSRMRKLVKPKLDILEGAQAKLRSLVADFSECKKRLDDADKVSSDIEETIQARIEDKKQLEVDCHALNLFLTQGIEMLKLLATEQEFMSTHVASMLEYEATLVGEAVVSAAVKTYAGVFTPPSRHLLFEAWRGDVSSQTLRVHATHSIVHGYASQTIGLWMKAAGQFHSRHNQHTAYILAYAVPVVVLTSFSPHMESLLLNVMHVVGCNSLVTKSALDKDLGHVLESCMAMGQQLIVHDVTPALYHAVFRELVEWTTEWVDETEFVVYQGHNVPLKGHFRLILTTHCSSCDFGSDIYAVTVVDSHACWDEMEHVLLDDIELSNVCNDKTSLGAYDYARNILDMEVDMERSLDALLTHLRSMIRESKYDSDMVNTLGSMCTLNAQHRTTVTLQRKLWNEYMLEPLIYN